MSFSILHITNWYPNPRNPHDALWIKRQIESLKGKCENEVYHIQVETGGWKFEHGTTAMGNQFVYIELPVGLWRIKEWIYTLCVLWVLFFKAGYKRFDLINFHIAYPLCTYLHWVRKVINVPLLITEHWSAYHYDFGIKKPEKLKRIQRIFQQGWPVMTVSQALVKDIRRFSGHAPFPSYVVPNVVDTKFFTPPENKTGEAMQFFMVSQWKLPKQPFVVLQAFAELVRQYPDITLRIGGYGPLYPEMKSFVKLNKLEENVVFLDRLNKEEIVSELQNASAFLHCSDYETFSVVCAEAICCGTPVIASAVGGIKEFIHDQNGRLVSLNDKKCWFSELEAFYLNNTVYDARKMAKQVAGKFSTEAVGEAYYRTIEKEIAAQV